MPARKLNVEDNTKYIPEIYKVVYEKTKYFYTGSQERNYDDLSSIKINEMQGMIPEILTSLSYKICLSEHRLRYQEEQVRRFHAANCQFNTNYYLWRNKSVEDFIKDYNNFLWQQIKKSHNNYSPKIEANYRRNYHDGEVSPVTSLVFYLYFKTDKVKRFFAKLFIASYRNPYTDKQANII